VAVTRFWERYTKTRLGLVLFLATAAIICAAAIAIILDLLGVIVICRGCES
jgi:hypothetical protein